MGTALLGTGCLAAATGFKSTGRAIQQKGRVLLNNLPSVPRGLQVAVEYPLIEALLGRRSRRFPLGCKIPDGPFAYESNHEPIPLSATEQILLLTSMAGNTGWQYLIPHNKHYSPQIPNYSAAAGGRTFPSAAGFHTTELFYTDDDGIYFFPTRDAGSLLQQDETGIMDFQSYIEAHQQRIRQLADSRLELPRGGGHMEIHNEWCANQPGSTLIIPVADAAQHHLLNLCYIVQNGACIYDDINDRPVPGLNEFSDIVDIKNPYPLSYIEQMTLSEVTIEVSTSCYAGALMLQALGLGGWTYGGLNPFSVLGASGDAKVPGLGFRFDTNDQWSLPNVTGRKGVFEAYCPPRFQNMKHAVEAVVERKFGDGGPFNKQTSGPYKNNARSRSAVSVHDQRFQQCVATIAQYIYDTFGRCPGTFSSIFTMMYLQAHHLDLGYYDKYFGPNSYLSTHADHMKNWH